MKSQSWQQMDINGARLEFRDEGSGEPVVFVHGGMRDEYAYGALLADPIWKTGYRVIRYHRRGYGTSARPQPGVTVGQQSSDCLELLRRLRVDRAHFAAQSYGGVIILQIMMDAPEVVHTAALLEPPLPSVMAKFPEFTSSLAKAAHLYESGDKRTAMEVFANAIVGSDVQPDVARKWRDEYFEAWLPDADAIFQSDTPALGQWNFTADNVRSIQQPVLNIMGSDSPAFFREVYARLEEWLPHAENVVIPGVSHPIPQMDPERTAETLVRFFRQHAMAKMLSTGTSHAR